MRINGSVKLHGFDSKREFVFVLTGLANSLRLFKEHKCFLQMIMNFSLRYRLHFFVMLLYGMLLYGWLFFVDVVVCFFLLMFVVYNKHQQNSQKNYLWFLPP